jgi:hypothetical protein
MTGVAQFNHTVIGDRLKLGVVGHLVDHASHALKQSGDFGEVARSHFREGHEGRL